MEPSGSEPSTSPKKAVRPPKVKIKMPTPVGSSSGLFVGANVHFDHRNIPLCSNSGKLCNQRRMDGYGFCFKHILEDKSAPFKQCEYDVNPGRSCHNAVSLSQEDSRYCNPHKQALGIIPKTERRPRGASLESSRPAINVSTPEPTSSLPESHPPVLNTNTSGSTTTTSTAKATTTITKAPETAAKNVSLLVETSDDDEWTPLYDSAGDYSDLDGSLYRPLGYLDRFLQDDLDLPKSPDSSNMDSYSFSSGPTAFNKTEEPFNKQQEYLNKQQELKIGDAGFDIETFALQRQQKLLKLLKVYRMKLKWADYGYSVHADRLHAMRVKEAYTLQNESEIRLKELAMRRSKAEKIHKRKNKDALLVARRKAIETKMAEASAMTNGGGMKQLSIEKAFGVAPMAKGSEFTALAATAKKRGEPKKKEDKASTDSKTPTKGKMDVTEESGSTGRAKTVLEPTQNCQFAGCTVTALPLSSFCYCHILHDPKQCLFTQCHYVVPSTGKQCEYPVVKYQDPPQCVNHADVILLAVAGPTPNKARRRYTTSSGSAEEIMDEDDEVIDVDQEEESSAVV